MIMNIFTFLLSTLEWIVLAYLLMATAYVVLFGIASVFPQRKNKASENKQRKFAVLIPGYKEDRVIVDVAKDALEQEYPQEKYEVIVIADSFKPETLEALKALPIRVVEVVFEVSKKSKALNKCMDIIGDDYDIAMILDADNIMAHNVLEIINDGFNRGYLAVQGHRMAKNTNTPYAVLDAISEEINNKIFRKGHRVLGFSSALIGSGMGIDYALFKKTMATVDSVGEDKEVELKLLKQGFKIEYAEDAFVYDEKTSKSDVFVNQRRRWIAAQLVYFKDYFFNGLKHLIRYGNVDYFDKVLQMIQPPRILLLGMLFILTAIAYATHLFGWDKVGALFFTSYEIWLSMFLTTIIVLLIVTPRKFFNFKTLKAILFIPHGFFMMVKSLLKIKGASKKFIHTTHDHTEKFDKKKKL